MAWFIDWMNQIIEIQNFAYGGALTRLPRMTPAPTPLDAFLHAIPKAELHCHLFGTVRHATFAALNRRAGAPLADAGDRGLLHARRKARRRAARAARARRPAGAHARRPAPPGLRVPAGRRRPQRALQRVLLEPDRHRARLGHRLPRGAGGDRARHPRRAARLRHHRPADRGHRPRGQRPRPRSRWCMGDGAPLRGSDRHRHRLPRGRPAARAVPAGVRATRGAPASRPPRTRASSACPGPTCAPRSTLLQVDRIDHGYTVVDHPAFARECAERGVLFTVVPTNSYYLRTLPPERWALDHPIRRMPGLGLRIHPEHRRSRRCTRSRRRRPGPMMVRDFGFGLDDLRGFMHNGLDGAWIDDSTRRALARAVERRVRRAARPARARHPHLRNLTMPSFKPLLLASLLVACARPAPPAPRPPGPPPSPITLIVPYSAGGSVDFNARLVATKLGERLKQSVVIENVTGAGGAIGVAKAVQRGPRRLHAGGRRRTAPIAIGKLVNPAGLQVRSAEGPGAGGHAQHRADGAGGAARACRRNNLARFRASSRKAAAGQVQLRHLGRRHGAAAGDGTAQGAQRHLRDPRALPRRRADRHRRDRQPGRPGDAGQHQRDPACERRPAEGAGRDRAASGWMRCPTCRPSTRCRGSRAIRW